MADQTKPFWDSNIFEPPAPVAPPVETTQPAVNPNDWAVINNAIDQGGDTLAALNIARQRGNNIAARNQVLQDKDNLDLLDLDIKYGNSRANDLARLNLLGAQDTVDNVPIDDRNYNQQVLDKAFGTASGVVQTAGNVTAALARVAGRPLEDLGAPIPEIAQGINTGTQYVSDALLSQTSPQTQAQAKRDAIKAQLDQMDSDEQYNRDVETNKSVPWLRQIGRDAMDSVERMSESPLGVEAGVSNAVGSLLTAGPLGRGIGVGLKGLGIAAGPKALTTTAIALQEGAGAYAATTAAINDMDPEELYKVSAPYRELVDKGVDPIKARTIVADKGGMLAAIPQAIIGAITGRFVAKFEANPLSARSLKGVLHAAVSEKAEEATQGLTGTAFQNFGEQQYGDSNKILTSGVGQATAEGGVYGFGSTLAAGAPGLAVRGAKGALTGTRDMARQAIAKARADAITYNTEQEAIQAKEKADKQAQNADELKGRVDTAAQNTPNVVAGLNTLASQAGVITPTPPVINNTGDTTTEPAPELTLDDVAGQIATAFSVANNNKSTTIDYSGLHPDVAKAIKETIDPAHTRAFEESFLNPDRVAALPEEERAKLEADRTEFQRAIKLVVDNINKNNAAKAAPPPVTENPEAIKTKKFIDDVANNLTITNEELDDLPPHLKAQAQGTTNRFDVIRSMANVAANPANSNEDRTSAALFIRDQISRNEGLFSKNLPDFLENVPHDNPLYKQFEEYAQVMSAIPQMDTIKEAMKWANESLNRTNAPITDENAKSDLANQIIKNTVRQAAHSPMTTHIGTLNQILDQNAKGNIQLTPESLKIIQSNKSLLETVEGLGKTLTDIGLLEQAGEVNNLDIVSKQIAEEGGAAEHQIPLSEYISNINTAAQNGNQADLKYHMESLNKFAQSMRNKVDAINRSIANKGSQEQYQAKGAGNALMDSKKSKPQQIHLGNEGSENYARRTHADAMAVAKIAREMEALFPSGNLEVTIPPLDSRIAPKASKSPTAASTTETPPTTPKGKTPASEAGKGSAATVSTDSTPAVAQSRRELDDLIRGKATPEQVHEAVFRIHRDAPKHYKEAYERTLKLNDIIAEEKAKANPDQSRIDKAEKRKIPFKENNAKFIEFFERHISQWKGTNEPKSINSPEIVANVARTKELKEKLKTAKNLEERNAIASEIYSLRQQLNALRNPKPETPPESKGYTKEAEAEFQDFINKSKDRLNEAIYKDPDLKEYFITQSQARREEKESDPKNWTEEEKAAYESGDWRKFSELRGYTKEEMDNFGRYYNLSIKFIEKYGEDVAADLNYDIFQYHEDNKSTDITEAIPPKITPAQQALLDEAGIESPYFETDLADEELGDTRSQEELTAEEAAINELVDGENALTYQEAFESVPLITDNTELDETTTPEPTKKAKRISIERAISSLEKLVLGLVQREDLHPAVLEAISTIDKSLKHAFANTTKANNSIKLIERAINKLTKKNLTSKAFIERREIALKALNNLLTRQQKIIADNSIEYDEFIDAFTKGIEDWHNKNIKSKKAKKAPVTEEATEEDTEEDEDEELESRADLIMPTNRTNTPAKNWFLAAYNRAKNATSRIIGSKSPLKDVRKALKDGFTRRNFMNTDVEYDLSSANLAALDDLLALGDTILGHIESELKKRFEDDVNERGNSLLSILESGGEPNRFIRGRALNILNGNHKYNPNLIQSAILAGLDWVQNPQIGSTVLTRDDVAKIMGIPEWMVEHKHVMMFNHGISITSMKQDLSQRIKEFWGVNNNRDTELGNTEGIAEAVAIEVFRGLQAVGLVTQGDVTFASNTVAIEYAELADNLTDEQQDAKVGDIAKKDKVRDYTRIYFDQRPDKIKKLLDNIGPASALLSDVILMDAEKPFYAGEGNHPTRVAKVQHRNPLVPTTHAQQQFIEHYQKQPHYLSQAVYDVIRNMGPKAFALTQGGSNAETSELNVNHQLSLEGINRTYMSSWENLMKQIAYVEAVAKAESLKQGRTVSPTEIPIYFNYTINRLNRPMMLGSYNPQADKLARELFIPAISTLDLSNFDRNNKVKTLKSQRDIEKFYMTVGQGLEVKTSKLPRSAVVEATIKQLAEKHGDAINQLEEWLQGPRNGGLPRGLSENLTGLTMHGIHGLIAVAQLNIAREKGGKALSEFTHYVTLEADGKANGPTNALVNFTTGLFNGEWIRDLERGGIFIGERNKSLNDHLQSGNVAGFEDHLNDIYEKVSRLFSQEQNSFRDSIKDNKVAKEHFDALMRLMSALNVSINFELDETDPNKFELTIKRDVIKNPVTITVYGSGINGIANNVTEELVKLIYAEISELMVQNPGRNLTVNDLGGILRTNRNDETSNVYGVNQFAKDLGLLTSSYIYLDNKDQEFKARKPNKRLNKDNGNGDQKNGFDTTSLRKFTFSEYNLFALQKNVKRLFVAQMGTAIQKGAMHHVADATATMQKAGQAMSIVFTHLFNNEVLKLTKYKIENKDKYPGYKQNDGLTQNELDRIFKKLRRFGPFVNTGTQNYFHGSTERTQLSGDIIETTGTDGKPRTVRTPSAYSRGLADDFKSPAFISGPGLAGVSTVPTTIVGTGDGAAVLPIREKGLPVFDGFYMAASDMDEVGKIINKGVFDSYQVNQLEDFAKAFRRFVESGGTDTLINDENPLNPDFQTFIKEMSQVFSGLKDPTGEDLLQPNEVLSHLKGLADLFEELAESSSLRKEAIRRVKFTSVDQMASAEAPYTHEGDPRYDISGLTAEDKAVFLNDLVEIIKAERKTETNNPIPPVTTAPVNDNFAVEPDNERVIKVFQGVGRADTATGTWVVENHLLEDLVGKILRHTKISNEQSATLKSSLNNLVKLGYKIVAGKPSDIHNYLEANFPLATPRKQLSSYGLIDPQNKMIYMTNIANETLIHELVHASTLEKLIAHYGGKPLSKMDTEAILRIESSLKEWLSINPDNISDEYTRQAYQFAWNVIAPYFNNGDMVEAVNEYMAWTLSNQRLINLGLNTELVRPESLIKKIINKAVRAIKTLVWGSGPISNNMHENLRFNTQILMHTLPTKGATLIEQSGITALHQSLVFGTSNYLTELRNVFNQRIASFIDNGDLANRIPRDRQVQRSLVRSGMLSNIFIANGFYMLPQAKHTFTAIQAALMVNSNLNNNSLTGIQDLYDHVMNNLTVESFMRYPNSNNPADRTQASLKYQTLTGIYGIPKDDFGRSTLMSSFLALAMTHEGFREVLSKVPLPPMPTGVVGANAPSEGDLLDAYMTKFGLGMMNGLANYYNGSNKNSVNSLDALNALTDVLLDNVGSEKSAIEQQTNRLVDGADNYMRDKINRGSQAVVNYARNISSTTTNQILKTATILLDRTASLFNETESTKLIDGLVSLFNKDHNFVSSREFFTEIVGRTESNKSLFDMIPKVTTMIQQARQHFREKIPVYLQSKFSRPITAEEDTHMLQAFAQTDIAELHQSLRTDGVLELFTNPNRLNSLIRDIENRLSSNQRWVGLKAKSEQLANYMNTGYYGPNLLTNAEAVAHLFNERGALPLGSVPQTLIDDLNKLISLYAVRGLDSTIKNTVVNLINTENDGTKFIFDYLAGTRADEFKKSNSMEFRLNHFKGNIVKENQVNTSLRIVNNLDRDKMLEMGYVEVGPYIGSSAERGLDQSYYFIPIGQRSTYQESVMTIVHNTGFGVDPRTGFTVNELTGGRIIDPQTVANLKRRIPLQRPTDENLLARFDEDGFVYAYERGVDPARLVAVNKNTSLSQMLGAWKGRQVEEGLAKEFNKQLVNNLHQIWVKEKQLGHQDQFVDISKSTDKIHKDSWKLVPTDMKQYINNLFGYDGFKVRRDMVNDALGFRAVSVRDLWTGNNRLKDSTNNAIKSVLQHIFGNDAYRIMVSTEQNLQHLVSEAKNMVVIKSVVVPLANAAANFVQALNRGIPLRDMLYHIPRKMVELNWYIKTQNKLVTLEADLHSATGSNNLVQMRKIGNQIQTLKDGVRRLSIFPLIEAGLFSSISAGGVTQEDLALANKSWMKYINNLSDSLPPGISTLYRNGLVTQDTSLFKGLLRAVQYGDFLFKAVMYEDLTTRKKMEPKEAIAKVTEEFVEYNRLAGRVRNALDSYGLTWFYHFKLRIMKIAIATARENPFRTLMNMIGSPALDMFGSISTPFHNNFFTMGLDGRLGYSLGPNMGLSSWQMLPFVQIYDAAT